MANSPCHASDEGSNAGVHAGALRAWGKDLRWVWPRDGNGETLEGAGIAVAEQYKAQGLNMLHDALMMLRFASTKAAYDNFRRPIKYPNLGYV